MKSSLRIAHIDTESDWRGGERQMVFLMNGLRQRGHTCIPVVKRNSYLASQLKQKGEKVIELASFGEWDVLSARRLQSRLQEESIDIVHAHTAHGVALAALATLKTSIPFVLTRRVDFPLGTNVFSRWKYRRAHGIMAISENVRRILIEGGIPDEKIRVVPSGVDFEKYKNLRPVSREELKCSKDAIVIGQVAALAAHKDQTTLIKAVSLLKPQFPRVELVLVGDGPEHGKLERLVQALGLSSSVKFLGFQKDPLRYMAGFDIFCLSSKEEGLGTSLLDAMAMGVPVVGTKAGGIPELIEHRVTGYLARAQDPDHLARTLAAALKEAKEIRDKMRDRAMRKTFQFDFSQTVAKTEMVYENILPIN